MGGCLSCSKHIEYRRGTEAVIRKEWSAVYIPIPKTCNVCHPVHVEPRSKGPLTLLFKMQGERVTNRCADD